MESEGLTALEGGDYSKPNPSLKVITDSLCDFGESIGFSSVKLGNRLNGPLGKESGLYDD